MLFKNNGYSLIGAILLKYYYVIYNSYIDVLFHVQQDFSFSVDLINL